MADKSEEQALRAEWERAQGMGRRLFRERLIATLAGMAAILVGCGLSFLLWWIWPLQKIPIALLVLPVVVSLPVGWWARTRLWPGGQFR